MSVKRIDSADGRTRGWQACVYTTAPQYLSAFFADRKHGGKRKARELAKGAELALQRKARRLKGKTHA